MPHFGHVIALLIVEVLAGAPTDVVIGMRAISSRSDIGRRDTYGRVVCVHTVRDIDPDDPANINSFLDPEDPANIDSSLACE